MSATQAKLMQYLPVVFAVFLFFYLTGLVIYYMAQAIFRIGLQYYITHASTRASSRSAARRTPPAPRPGRSPRRMAAAADCSPTPSAS